MLTRRLMAVTDTGIDGIPLLRLKGIFHTDRGWYLLQIAEGKLNIREADPQRESRVEWVSDGEPIAPASLADAIAGEGPTG